MSISPTPVLTQAMHMGLEGGQLTSILLADRGWALEMSQESLFLTLAHKHQKHSCPMAGEQRIA